LTDYFDRPDAGEQAVIVHMHMQRPDTAETLEEFIGLVHSAGVHPLATVTGSRKEPHKRWFIGSGKLEEVQAAVLATGANVVLFNHELSATQERNLEQSLQCRVVSRVGLILDIFAQRARTYEGQLQVELAQLSYLSTRLVRGWTHLERQKGGIGLRGPGETQLETDRRLLRKRVDTLQAKLIKVRQQRAQGRAARQKAQIPNVVLVGYTNAGKSTLFNRLTQSQVYAADQLFATLDPTSRRLLLPTVGQVVLADTVGFIRHLPTTLIEAFNATLEEVVQADLLLHLIDANHVERDDQMHQVQHVLAEIGADHRPCLEVFNKVDQLTEVQIAKLKMDYPRAVLLSAQSGEGLDVLATQIARQLLKTIARFHIMIPPHLDRFRAFLHSKCVVIDETTSDESLNESLPPVDLQVVRELGAPAVQSDQAVGQRLTIACDPEQWARWLAQFELQC
jgi:GTP-binding protein HflX